MAFDDDDPLRVLAISGSLRARSSNTELLRAVGMLAPTGVRVALYNGLGTLPLFNPDLDEEGAFAPNTVRTLRDLIDAADALVISSPEYAHGVPGALKNALDWLVSAPEMPGKPVAVLNASARSTHAHAALVETLATMSGAVSAEASVTVPLDGRRLGAGAMTADADLAARLEAAVAALARDAAAYRERRTPPRLRDVAALWRPR
jgi:chromate reductase, NAD(P)H dehydrogenase (quinone)